MRFTNYLLPAIALFQSVYAGLEDVKSTKTLTVSNFDSTIAGKDSIVAFYAPWCGHCKNLAPVWEKLGKDFEDEEKVIIGQLDADNASNRPVGERYGVRGFPTIKFFPADGSAPLDYSGPRTEEAFIEFINEKAGTHRTSGGLLNQVAGRLPNFDALLAQFLSSTAATRDSVLAQAREAAASLQTDSQSSVAAQYYLKVMEKVQANSDWASSELTRLQKLAQKRGTMASKQVDDLQIRQNILNAYENAKASAASIVNEASASVVSVASDASASVDSATSVVGASASSASSVVSSVINSATGGGVSASASSASNQAAGSASSASSQASASASSASKQASASASSLSKQATGSASSLSGAAASATESAKSVVNDAYASGESLASQASASVDSATSKVASQATGAATAVREAAESGYGKIVGEL